MDHDLLLMPAVPLRPVHLLDHEGAYDVEGSSGGIAPIEEIITEARQGRPFILVDAPDRENEGDLVIPAQFASPALINFMAAQACGLICLAITPDRARRLDLRPMSADNRSGHGTAFTVSIEARTGVTTGISAFDRAKTIAVAIDPASGANDIVTPGHVFPLVARDGGVLVRAGHTEAAVDIARLAGLEPAGVICEIMNEDGSMSRLPDLLTFAARHGLKVGAISDLIAHRRRSECLVQRTFEGRFDCRHGNDFRVVAYRNTLDEGEHLALVRGNVSAGTDTLVRIHQIDLAADLLGGNAASTGPIDWMLGQLARHPGPAVAVFIQDRTPLAIAKRLMARGRHAGHLHQSRHDHGVGAQILKDLGVGRMRVMTSSSETLAALQGFGLTITGRAEMRV